MDCRNFIVSKIETVRVCISGQNLLLDSPELEQLTAAPTKKILTPNFLNSANPLASRNSFFFLMVTGGSPPECIDIEVGPKPSINGYKGCGRPRITTAWPKHNGLKQEAIKHQELSKQQAPID